MTSIALFGDLHGNSAATAAVLDDIDAHAPDHVVCLGDLVGYGPFPNEVIDLVRSRNIPTIMGNYDAGVAVSSDDCGCAYKDDAERANGEKSIAWTNERVTDKNKAWLQLLLPEYRIEINGVRIRVVHGSPRRINEYLFEDRDSASLARIARSADCDVLVFGHTHKPWFRDVEGVLFVNAGSVGKPKDADPRAGWALLEVSTSGNIAVNFHRVEYDVAAMAEAIRAEAGLPDIYADDIETGGVITV